MITQRSSSGTKTTRGSSKPHCSLSTPSVGREQRLRVDRSSRRRRSAERATVRCEIPRRSSTRARSDGRVVELRRGRVEDGVDRIRPVVRRQDRVGGVAREELARALTPRRGLARPAGGARPAGRPRRAAAPRGGTRASTRRPRCRSSSPRRGRRCSRRSRSRTAAGASRLRPRNQSNARCARTPCSGSPVTANAASSASTNAEASSGCSSPLPGAGSSRRRPRWPVSRSVPSARPDSSPSQRSASSPVSRQVLAAERDAADDQRVRQPGVVVGERRPRTSASRRAACDS